MAYIEDKTIDGLDALTSLDDTDVLVAGDQSDSDRAKKITKANFEADLALTASQVSDFDTEVGNNSAVTANTAKVSFDSTSSTRLANTSGTNTGDQDLSTYQEKPSEGAFVDGDKTKLDGIEALADVTDATNVASSGGVLNTGNETIAGIKTFSSSPIVPAPTTDLQASTKKYVDDNAGGAPEGTAVLSTGETVGKVLQADGDDTSSWVTLPGGGDALVANPLSQFAATTSLQLKGVISDETGSGSVVFATSPTLVTPALGTPSALVATNATGTASGLTAGLATDTVAKTGTGSTYATSVSPVLTTPNIGSATGSISGNAGTVTTITGLAPDTATTQATQAGITTCANLVTVGTIGTGTWQGTAINQTYLTGQSGTNTGDEVASSSSVAGVAELAISSEIDTGTDTTRIIPIDQFVASKRNIRWLTFNLVEAGTDCEAAENIAGDFLSPIAGTILQSDSAPFYIYATNSTAGVTGTMVVDVSIGGTSIMTTNKIDIDTTEKTSTTGATQPDLTTTALAVGDIITIDIDAVHTTAAKGLTVYIAIRE